MLGLHIIELDSANANNNLLIERRRKITMEERKAEIRKGLEALFNALLALCPAYNPLIFMLRHISAMKTSKALSLYPEIVDKELVKIFTELFGIKLGRYIEIADLGKEILEFAKNIEEKMESETVQDIFAEFLGKKLEKTPARDYVEICVEALKEDEIALRALRVLAELGYTSYGTLISEIKKRFGIEYSKDQLMKSLQKAYELALLSSFSESLVGVRDIYRKHLLEVIKI